MRKIGKDKERGTGGQEGGEKGDENKRERNKGKGNKGVEE